MQTPRIHGTAAKQGNDTHSVNHRGKGGWSLRETPWLLVFPILFNVLAGFNNGGNMIGSLLATRAFTPLGASLTLALGVALGPWIVGTAVAHTILYRVVSLPRLGSGVYAASVSGGILVAVISWWRALPTSTTLGLIGALIGAGIVAGGWHAVAWGPLSAVLAGQVVALGAGTLSGLLIWHALRQVLRHVGERAPAFLRGLQPLSAALVGVGYGGNDAEKAMGLFAFVGAWSTAAGRQAAAAGHLPIPAWAVWASVATFAVGMAVGGIRIAKTVGFRFYPIRSTDAVATQLACGLTVLAAGSLGEPISTTQTSTAALLASGAARRLTLPRWLVVREMVLSWLIALPLGLASGGVLTEIMRLAGGMR